MSKPLLLLLLLFLLLPYLWEWQAQIVHWTTVRRDSNARQALAAA
jgi:hypothetical protein